MAGFSEATEQNVKRVIEQRKEKKSETKTNKWVYGLSTLFQKWLNVIGKLEYKLILIINL